MRKVAATPPAHHRFQLTHGRAHGGPSTQLHAFLERPALGGRPGPDKLEDVGDAQMSRWHRTRCAIGRGPRNLVAHFDPASIHLVELGPTEKFRHDAHVVVHRGRQRPRYDGMRSRGAEVVAVGKRNDLRGTTWIC